MKVDDYGTYSAYFIDGWITLVWDCNSSKGVKDILYSIYKPKLETNNKNCA